MKFLAILMVRNEAGFVLEWLAHHRAVGFTDFLVFSNDCQDGTDTMLDHLAGLGQLTHIRNDGPYDKRGIQFTALKLADRLEMVQQADWILTLDIDEFVNIHVGDRTLPALIGALPEASAITLTWRLFGNDGIARYEDRPVTEVFTACAPEIIHWPWRAAMFKTLYRNDGIYRKPGVHRPRSPDKDRLAEARWFDCAGRELGADFRTTRLFSDYGRPLFGLAQLNHYVLGAMDSFVLKSDRGRVNHTDAMMMDYWIERNFNTDRDDTIRQMAGKSAPLLRALKEDETLARLHDGAVKWRKDRFDTLMQQDIYRDLYARLLMAAPSRPVEAAAARMLTRYARKAHANRNKSEKPA
jgi:glycosyl transferase family 2